MSNQNMSPKLNSEKSEFKRRESLPSKIDLNHGYSRSISIGNGGMSIISGNHLAMNRFEAHNQDFNYTTKNITNMKPVIEQNIELKGK